jgi:hypothetical protein
VVLRSPQTPGKLVIVHFTEQSDFGCRLAARRGCSINAPSFLFRHDFADCAFCPVGEDGVGHTTELFQFGYAPRFYFDCSTRRGLDLRVRSQTHIASARNPTARLAGCGRKPQKASPRDDCFENANGRRVSRLGSQHFAQDIDRTIQRRQHLEWLSVASDSWTMPT